MRGESRKPRQFPDVCYCIPCEDAKKRQESRTKCCFVCTGCSQRIKNVNLDAHLATCVAYRQVIGEIPLDYSWFEGDPEFQRGVTLRNPMVEFLAKQREGRR